MIFERTPQTLMITNTETFYSHCMNIKVDDSCRIIPYIPINRATIAAAIKLHRNNTQDFMLDNAVHRCIQVNHT